MAVIRYIGGGASQPAVNVAVSVNNGQSWKEKKLLSGQSFPIPPNVTTLLIDNVPYDPKGNYEIRQGKVSRR